MVASSAGDDIVHVTVWQVGRDLKSRNVERTTEGVLTIGDVALTLRALYGLGLKRSVGALPVRRRPTLFEPSGVAGRRGRNLTQMQWELLWQALGPASKETSIRYSRAKGRYGAAVVARFLDAPLAVSERIWRGEASLETWTNSKGVEFRCQKAFEVPVYSAKLKRWLVERRTPDFLSWDPVERAFHSVEAKAGFVQATTPVRKEMRVSDALIQQGILRSETMAVVPDPLTGAFGAGLAVQELARERHGINILLLREFPWDVQ